MKKFFPQFATALILFILSALAMTAQTLTTLQSFDGVNGENPEAGLTQATNGDLYGTSHNGGDNSEGAVFRISPTGLLTDLYNFCSQPNCVDGAAPGAGVVQALNGDLYGTTSTAGKNSFFAEYGTVFKVNPAGVMSTLYNFCSQPNCADGAGPVAGLVQAVNGDFYGTTGVGGLNDACSLGCGTIFKINSTGAFTTLYNFCSQVNCPDGSAPQAGLVLATGGDLYGTTRNGGAFAEGTVFRITPDGALTTIYSFCSQTNCADGAGPIAGLIQATDGDFYGTTKLGGSACVPHGCGTLFKITPDGDLKTIYSFCSQANCADGQYPSAGVIQATDGNLYGTTNAAGANSSFAEYGTVFRVVPSGTLTTLYSFCSHPNCTDGAAPSASLVQATNGNLYGTTVFGGANGISIGGWGTVFELSVGLGSFVQMPRNFGKPGDAVEILGTSLTGTTAVRFGGVSATFQVVSATLISAKIPEGAVSGSVEVTTTAGTLSSSAPFHVVGP